MAEKPLLIFPEHRIAPRDKEKRSRVLKNYNIPKFQRQRERLTPQFESMLRSFITDTTEGIEPEYVLVLETVGKIEDFERAVRAIKGLEWLAEIDTEEMQPDEDYYMILKVGNRFFSDRIDAIDARQSKEICKALKENDFIDEDGLVTGKPIERFKENIPIELSEFSEKIVAELNAAVSESKSKLLGGRLFMSMSNRQAMEELQRLWKKWDDPKKKLKRGYGKWKDIFRYLKKVRPWDTQDRMRDTGILEYWAGELEFRAETGSNIPFEIELWYRRDSNRRKQAEDNITQLIREEGGKIIAACTIDQIRFHSIKAELPPENIEKVLNHEYTRIFKSSDVMFFRPTGQCSVELIPEGEMGEFFEGTVSGDPVVAILDGSPFASHKLLENRLIIDDPDEFESRYLANERKHGTAMASLVCHGELDAGETPLNRPVYMRPIMTPNENDPNSPRGENIPDENFLEDLIERSVRRIFEGDGEEGPVAPSVKIINLSIADASRMFFSQLSPTAKLLDWLSHEYKVLFCVSAGNIPSSIDLRKSEIELKSLSEDELIKHTMNRIQADIRNRRLLAPADSINALTIGALHADKSNPFYVGNRIDILPNSLLPSPISAHGHGFRNSIKPEIYLPGGRQLYNYRTNNTYAIDNSVMPPGQKIAATSINPGENNRYAYARGTSNAAALGTRGAAQIFEVLNELREETPGIIPEENIAVLLKALLVHATSWGKSEKILKDCLKNENDSRQFKKTLSRYLGFGIPDINRVLECTSQRATAIGSGVIGKDEKHEFRFPLPPCLSGSNERRRLIITLAWFSPINPDNRKFRKANLSFEPQAMDELGVRRQEADGKQVKNGTVQHEILVGDSSASYQDGDHLVIPVICREDAGTLDEDVYYGLAVTLEVSETIDIPIYEEIKARIGIPIHVREE